MGRLYISKLVYSGEKGTSEIVFGENLTIIMGPSDTGKSYIYKSIYYMFGASNDSAPFEKSIGYDMIKMELIKNLKSLTLTRQIGSNIISVFDGNKTTDYKTSSEKANVRDFFASLLDIKIGLKIPKNADGQTQRFSLRTLKSLLTVNESDTELEKSILLPDNYTARTAFLSGLLYILYDQDFSEFDADENKKTKAAKKAAVQKYIISNKEKLIGRRETLSKYIEGMEKDSQSLDTMIDNWQIELDATNKIIDESIVSIKNIGKKIIDAESSIRQLNLQIERYSILESQYISDINRLGFITQGEDVIHNHKSPINCPFCSGDLDKSRESSYLEASRAEAKKILASSIALSNTIDDVSIEKDSLINTLEDLRKEKSAIEQSMNNELKPYRESIKFKINTYNAYIKTFHDLESTNLMLSNFESDLSNLDSTVDKHIEYKPKDLFPDDFASSIGNYYYDILKNINFTPLESVVFDMNDFDIIVNGDAKKTHGKGYRALLNTILILSMRKYINEVSINNPHFYLIDSPLHGLTMPDEISRTEDVRQGFFKYLVNNIENDQMIVIENVNTSDLPENIESYSKVKVIEFTQDENRGRYGLLNGIRKN